MLAFRRPLERGSADECRPEREDQGRDLRPARAASGRPRRPQPGPCDLRSCCRIRRSQDGTGRRGRSSDAPRDSSSVHDPGGSQPHAGAELPARIARRCDADSAALDAAIRQPHADRHAASERPGRGRPQGAVFTPGRRADERANDQPNCKPDADAAASRDSGAHCSRNARADAARNPGADTARYPASNASPHAESHTQGDPEGEARKGQGSASVSGRRRRPSRQAQGRRGRQALRQGQGQDQGRRGHRPAARDHRRGGRAASTSDWLIAQAASHAVGSDPAEPSARTER